MNENNTIELQLREHFGIEDAACRNLNTLANDTYEVVSSSGKYALKLYNPVSRTIQDVAWELELINYLLDHGIPTANPVTGTNGQLQSFVVDGTERPTVLFEWLPGEKTRGSHENYVLEGALAAQIHLVADNFASDLPREDYNAQELIGEQFRRMKDVLVQVDRWEQACELGERLKQIISDPKLDYGVCHMDLTFDNIHISDGKMTVFDFDSAGTCWRAYEPYGVLRNSADFLQSWLSGYRTIREFSNSDEQAVWAFAIIGEIRNTTWKLGLANSSRGKPLLDVSELANVIDGWLEWEKVYILHE